MTYAVNALRVVVPFVALAVVGIILLWRHRDVVTALIALGFASVALCHITSTLMGLYTFSDPAKFAAAANRFGWALTATRWGISIGLWVGCLGLLLYTLLPSRRQYN